MFGTTFRRDGLTAGATLGTLCLLSSLASAQICPADDANEPNDSCASPLPIGASPVIDLAVTNVSDDYWSISVPAMMDCTLDVLFIHANVDIDVVVFDSTCFNQVGASGSGTDNEQVIWSNTSAVAQTFTIEIDNFLQLAACGDYAMSYSFAPSANPCSGLPDDGLEDNDTCATALASTTGIVGTGLFVSKTDSDFYSISVPAGMGLQVDALFPSANGDIDVEVYDDPGTCANLVVQGITVTDNESVTADNLTAGPLTYIVRVLVWGGSTLDCNNYDLTLAVTNPACPGPEDAFEENDDCLSSAPITPGLYTNLFVLKEGVDSDFFTIDVLDGATITVDALFPTVSGDIDLALYDDCSQVNPFAPIASSQSVSDNESVQDTNLSGATKTYFFEVYVWAGDTNECQYYDLNVDVQGGMPGNITPYCFGDGSGTPCPCGNNSIAGHPGGCANSAGNGGILTATGDASVMADTLNLDLASASQNSFALLVSGVNQLPQVGGCIGCGIPAFDGLRCAGGQFLRHGSRATNGAGETGNGWGPPGGPPGGLIAANGFMMGETRNFFAFYRDNTAAVCMTGQNSSNGISITFQP